MIDRTYRILLLGDFHFGESYSRAGARVLAEKGYEHSLKHLRPFVERADHFIINLETPLVDPMRHPSPIKGEKTYIHWADPQKTPEALRGLGVDAVSLANNHTLDHGVEGLISSFESLSAARIAWFGAGNDIEEARKPYVISLPESVGGGEVQFHASFQYSKGHDEKFHFYAKESTAGCAPLSRGGRSVRRGAEDALHIAFPHWGANYKWRGSAQERLGDMLLDQGFDFVLGHGSHCLQQLERRNQRWVAYSIGNGNFQSGGRFQRYIDENGILPMGAWAMLHIELTDAGERHAHLRLYPVYSDNKAIDFRPGPVSREDFYQVLERLREEATVQSRFDNDQRDFGCDELGWYIRADIGKWPVDAPPEKHAPGVEGKTAVGPPSNPKDGRVYRDAETLGILEEYASGRNLGALLNARAAKQAGADVKWVSLSTAVAEFPDRRLLLNGYKCDESDLGARIVQDKYLLKELLHRAGVASPKGSLVTSAEHAVQLAGKLEGPVVVKPRSGNKGKGITVNIHDRQEIIDAFYRAKEIGGGVLVEQHIPVESEYRCLATPSECVSVVKRILPNVTGDGKSTILELIDNTNESRKYNPALLNRYIPVDEVTEGYLRKHGFGLETVLEPGRNVTVRDVGGLSSGGEPHEYSEIVAEEVKVAAYEAVRAIPGLTWGGVDVVTSKDDRHPYIIEINSDADIGGATYPLSGPPKDVAGRMLQERIDSPRNPSSLGTTILNRNNSLQTIRDATESHGSESSSIRLSEILVSRLRRQGNDVSRQGPGILKVVDHNGKFFWMTTEVLGSKDLSGVRRVVRRHGTVRRLLGHSNVPRTLAKKVSTATEANEFLSGQDGQFVLLPPQSEWDGQRTRVIEGGSTLSDGDLQGSRFWFIQSHSPTDVVRVVAGSKDPLVCFGYSRNPLSEETLSLISNIAVEAVRAVPELRWAAVDVRVRSAQGRKTALVEGLTVNPTLYNNMNVLGGSFEACFEEVLMPYVSEN